MQNIAIVLYEIKVCCFIVHRILSWRDELKYQSQTELQNFLKQRWLLLQIMQVNKSTKGFFFRTSLLILSFLFI